MAGERPLCGILIGGAARRLGGFPKGLLPDPERGEPLVVRLAGLLQAAGLDCLLVGQRLEYAPLGLPMLADSPEGVGPLGGLAALLEAAVAADCQAGVVALSCDLPRLSAALLGRLLDAALLDESGAPWEVLAAQRQGRWEPLCTRYRLPVLPQLRRALAASERSFQQLFRRLRVQPLLLSPAEQHELDDWDQPSDLPAGLRS